MKSINVTDLIKFSPEGPHKAALLESEHLWSEIVCLDKGQELGPFGDSDADGLFTIFAGEAMVFVAGKRARMKQWDSVIAPAGADVVIRNASGEPAVVLVVTAPPPSANSEASENAPE